MKTVYLNDIDSLSDGATQLLPSVATIGFFDGVHLGHQYLLRRVIDRAHRKAMGSIVITFDRHPRQVLQADYQPRLLTTLSQRLILLSRSGVDTAVVIRFTREMADLSAYEFMDRVLRRLLNVKELIMGYDNRFGRRSAETFDDYVGYGRRLGIDVLGDAPFVIDGVRVSSSVVRSLLQEGEIALANKCLGYPYTITGKVVSGFQEGRHMGFPTANIDLEDSLQLVPANGVYAITARVEQTVAQHPGMMNIGFRPTFGGTKQTLEAFIFNFTANLYDHYLSVSFVQRIREERKFDNVTLLVEQLKDDERMVRNLFKTNEEE